MNSVTTIKCPCGHPGCSRYGLSEGVFYQGTGWSKERAEEIAQAINEFDARKDGPTAQDAEKVTPKEQP